MISYIKYLFDKLAQRCRLVVNSYKYPHVGAGFLSTYQANVSYTLPVATYSEFRIQQEFIKAAREVRLAKIVKHNQLPSNSPNSQDYDKYCNRLKIFNDLSKGNN